MPRKTGYLANVLNVPPLIFRFQYNPDLLVEKKSYRYEQAANFGRFSLDKAEAGAASGALSAITGFLDDLKEIGSILTNTRPLEPVEGEPRSFEVDFALDAQPTESGVETRYGGSIVPDLEILRSFLYPSLDPLKIPDYFSANPPCWNRPPTCLLRYGGVSADCVMTDLSIKMTRFAEDGEPSRAEVTATLKEQSYSIGAIVDTVVRAGQVVRSLGREGIGEDFLYASPVGSIASLFT
ncbi:MAG: hypothetical protein AB7L84_09420 [Acidimicrobiia bacterium]